jgi:hypothetical protein
MQLQSDATLLRMLKALGAVRVYICGEPVWAIFDNAFIDLLSEPGIESRAPGLTCRTSDAERVGATKDSDVSVGTELYRVKRSDPDGTGMTNVVLKR